MKASESLQNGQSIDPEKALRIAFDGTPAFIQSARPDGDFDYFNRCWLHFLGSRPWRMSAVGTGRNRFIRKMELYSFKNGTPFWQVGNPFEVEARVRRADGTYRDEFLSKQPVASVAT